MSNMRSLCLNCQLPKSAVRVRSGLLYCDNCDAKLNEFEKKADESNMNMQDYREGKEELLTGLRRHPRVASGRPDSRWGRGDLPIISAFGTDKTFTPNVRTK